jgi:hypothetical protein
MKVYICFKKGRQYHSHPVHVSKPSFEIGLRNFSSSVFELSKKTVKAAENDGHLTSGLCMQAISSLLTFPSFSYHTAIPGWLIKLHCTKKASDLGTAVQSRYWLVRVA